jgi:SAM-dependent methyltransferase
MNVLSRPAIKTLSPTTDYSFNQIWYEVADEFHFWMQWRLAVLIHQLRCLDIPLDQPWTGADIGCGRGVLRNQLHNMTAWVVDGIDLNIDILKQNQTEPGQLFLYNILEKHKELESRYQFLFVFDILEHITDPALFLEACLFHLKRGGYLFINVPALESQKSAYDQAIGHLRRYNKKTLSREIINADLKILDLRYWGLFLLPFLCLRKITSSTKQCGDEIIKKGFKPPNKTIHSLLKLLMNIETSLFKRVPLGTSLMVVAMKK